MGLWSYIAASRYISHHRGYVLMYTYIPQLTLYRRRWSMASKSLFQMHWQSKVKGSVLGRRDNSCSGNVYSKGSLFRCILHRHQFPCLSRRLAGDELVRHPNLHLSGKCSGPGAEVYLGLLPSSLFFSRGKFLDCRTASSSDWTNLFAQCQASEIKCG